MVSSNTGRSYCTKGLTTALMPSSGTVQNDSKCGAGEEQDGPELTARCGEMIAGEVVSTAIPAGSPAECKRLLVLCNCASLVHRLPYPFRLEASQLVADGRADVLGNLQIHL